MLNKIKALINRIRGPQVKSTMLNLATIPLETSNVWVNGLNKKGAMLAEIMRTIDFPNRDKFLIGLHYRSPYLTLQQAVIDTETGSQIILQHNYDLRDGLEKPEHLEQFDEEELRTFLTRAVFVCVCQMIAHEFTESFRSKGVVLYNPHFGNRNRILFKAMEDVAPRVLPVSLFKTQAPKVETVTTVIKAEFKSQPRADLFDFALPFGESIPASPTFEERRKDSAKPPRGSEGFAKFFHQPYQDEKRKAA